MSFLKKLFSSHEKINPIIQFGRYSDVQKTESKNKLWDQAMDLFSKKQYYNSYEKVLDYLSDKEVGNISYEKNNDIIRFTMLQGSKKIMGLINQDGFYAEAKVAHSNTLDVGLMRTLLEENYHLRYSRFAIDTNENITVIFQSDHLDASPFKLYFGLEELALRADNNDDFFVNQFKSLTPLNMDTIFEESEQIKSAKYTFWVNKLNDVIDLIENGPLDGAKYPGAIAYLMLSTLYSFDYLIKPEGLSMKLIEKANNIFFNSKTISPEIKNVTILDILKELKEVGEIDLKSELYSTIKTFGVGKPGNHNRLNDIIDSELRQMDWYLNKGFSEYALSIPSFIVGNVLFTYSLPKVDRALLQIYYEVVEHDFFDALGFNSLTNSNGQINRKNVISRVTSVINKLEGYYQKIEINTTLIDTKNMGAFAKSYLVMMHQLKAKK